MNPPASPRDSAKSTSVTLSTSRTPSPSASPISPTGALSEGLSKRHSWHRGGQERTVEHTSHGALLGLGLNPGVASPRAKHSLLGGKSVDHVMKHPEEYDLGTRTARSSSFSQPRPYFHTLDSEQSLDNGSNGHHTPEDEDDQRLAFAPPPMGAHRRQPSRAYDEQGNPRVTGIGERMAVALSRNATLKGVSRSIRQASGRVVNIRPEEGRERLKDEEEAVTRLRGKSFGLFGPESRIRNVTADVLNYPYTEPIILLLIILNVIILVIQSSRSLNTPRPDQGYFNTWEDYVLLALFVVFTIEMFARMLVTGLILGPDTTVQQVMDRVMGTVRRIPPRPTRKPSKPWQSFVSVPPPRKSFKCLPEAPFEQAVERQRVLFAQGRPYLRHSWHRIDMIAIIAFWVMFLLALTGKEATDTRHVYIFRALSVLRAGRLLVITSATTTILHSLKRAVPMLITVGFFLVFAFTLFCIIGVQSFRGSLRRVCVLEDPRNSSNIIELGQQCGGFLGDSFNPATYLNQDGTPASGKAKGFICPGDQTCQTIDTNPDGDSMSFDNVFASLIQVVTISTVNGWAPIMYAVMDSDFFSSCLYFIVAVIVLNFWFLNLLTAVVVSTFKDVRTETKRSAFGAIDAAVDPESKWTTTESKLRKATGSIMKMYNRTELLWVALVCASVVLQACKTDKSSQRFLDLIASFELGFTFAFDVEIAVRIIGHFPDWQLFLASPRNTFDLFLAIVCSITQIPAISSSAAYPWLTVFQLLRWYRVILAVPRMKPLLVTVFGSFAGLLNMIIFLMLVNLIGAIAAVQLFRGDIPEGETITLSNTWNAFLGMYQVFSSENWTDLLYLSMESSIPYKQRWIAAAFFCLWILFAYAIVLQMFIAVINENFAVAEEVKRRKQIEVFIRRIEPATAKTSWVDRLNPYRLVSVRAAAKVETLPSNIMLPMKQAVGPDVGTGQDERDQVKINKDALVQFFGREREQAESIPLRKLGRLGSHKLDTVEDVHDKALRELLPRSIIDPSADEHLDGVRERRNQQADFITAHPSYDHSLWLFTQSNPVRQFCQSCVVPSRGSRIFGKPVKPMYELTLRSIIFAMVVASIIIAAVATPEYRKQHYADRGVTRTTWFDLAEVALGVAFVVEAGIKIIADGFLFCPNAYLLSIWNILDFLILITLLVNTTTSLIYIGGLSRGTRALKAFRALRLITLSSRLRETLHAVLFAGALKLLDASILMVLYLIPFAVWGLNIFSGLLYSCNDGTSDIGACVGEFLTSPVDDSLSYLVPRVWTNPTVDDSKWTFDSFRRAFLILFEIVSLEGWIDVMVSTMGIVGLGKQPQPNAAPWNSIFFLLFNLLGAVVILTLFLSIIIGNFSTRSGDALLTREQRHWVDLHKFLRAQAPSRLPRETPQDGFRAWCYQRSVQKHGYWQRGSTAVYVIHLILLMFEDFSNNILTDLQLDWIFLALTSLYAVDLGIRLYGLGFKSFRANGWNIFDVLVVAGSFATTIPALQAAIANHAPSQTNTQLQKLFLVAIPFKLVQRVSSLNQLFKTTVASLPAIGNLFLLWATLFIFFAIILLEVFGLTKMGNNAGTRFQNYYKFGNALVMLSFMSTGEGWNGYMHDYTIAAPRCTTSDNYLQSDCGSAGWAFGLFISWNIIGMYIFANMFTAVVVEAFAYVYQMPGQASLTREDMRAFKTLWSEFDTERSGYLRRQDVVAFLSRLTGIWDVRLYPADCSIQNLMRTSVPDPVDKAAGKLLVVTGVKRAVDIRRIEAKINTIDYNQVRKRRQVYTRLYHEARISEEPGRGISFTSMLMMLAHHKLIDDEKALLLDDLLIRREKIHQVNDLVSLDRVRSLLQTVHWRRRFLASRRTLAAEQDGIPAIVLEPTSAYPPLRPASDHDVSPVSSRSVSPTHRLSVDSHVARRTSDASMLSLDSAHRTRESSDEEAVDVADDHGWGDMMRDAVDREDA